MCLEVVNVTMENLNNEQKERLILLVREYPCLYKHTSKGNKDVLLKENAWIEISKVMYGDEIADDKKVLEKGT